MSKERQSPWTRTAAFSELCFDRIESLYRHRRTQNLIWASIVVLFVTTGFAIELGNLGLIPVWSEISPLYSIHLAFTAVLVTEIFELILSFPRSFSEAVRRQIEIFSLILLRQAFEVLADIADGEEVSLGLTSSDAGSGIASFFSEGVGLMTLEIAAALGIFALMALFRRLVEHPVLPGSDQDRTSFVQIKKCVALILLGVLAGLLGLKGYRYLVVGEEFSLLQNLYVALIYADTLLIVISYRFDARYDRMFRNSAFASSALLMRLGLAAPPVDRVFLGIFASLILCGTGLAYSSYLKAHSKDDADSD